MLKKCVLVLFLSCIISDMALAKSVSDMARLEDKKLIIAHRGASGYLPEHTLEAKSLAYGLGSPYIEQDLAMTKDDRLVVVHDIYLDRISDVASKFPNRARKDGRFYVIDFTLEELRTLKLSEGFDLKKGKRVPVYKDRFPLDKSRFSIHTFEEEIELIQGLNKSMGKDVGLYVETKMPWFHTQEGKDISKATLLVLQKYGYTSKKDKVFFQSFDYPNLKYVKDTLLPELKMDIKLVALVGKNDWGETFELKNGSWQPYNFNFLLDKKNIREIAKVVDGLGPSYDMLLDVKKSKKGKIIVNDLVSNAHKYKLLVHPYTIRKDSLPKYARNINELFEAILFEAGADGVFTDFPDLGLEFLKERR